MMSVAGIALIRKLWPIAAALAALLGLWLWHTHAVSAAVRTALTAQEATYRAAQVAADTAAKANVARVETAQTTITGKVEHDTSAALDDLAAQYRAYRLQHASVKGVASACHSASVPDSPAVTAEAGEPADVVVAAPLALIEEGDELRLQTQGWIDWYNQQRAINRADTP